MLPRPLTVRRMARILICDPTPSVSELFAHVVTRMNHEPVVYNPYDRWDDAEADVLLIEPDELKAIAFAFWLRLSRPNLPIVCVSIRGRSPEASALKPVAYLVKPFALRELERALAEAVRLAD